MRYWYVTKPMGIGIEFRNWYFKFGPGYQWVYIHRGSK